jgi:hypothetical protein
MCALKRELLVDFDEMNRIEIECPCGTSLVIDVSKSGMTPARCAACNTEYGKAFERAFQDYRATYGRFGDINKIEGGTRVRVRIPVGRQIE